MEIFVIKSKNKILIIGLNRAGDKNNNGYE